MVDHYPRRHQKKQREDAAEFLYIGNVFSVFVILFLILEWNIYLFN